MKKFIFIFYSIFLILFTLFSFAFIDPSMFYLKALYSGFFFHREITTITYICALILFFGFYVYFLKTANKQTNISSITLCIGLTTVILFFAYPAMLSFDIFNYIATAKILFLYKENPYIIMPINIPNEPLLAFMRASNKIALYGPVWIIFTGVPFILSFGNFILSMFLFKLLAIASYIGLTVLIWKFTKNVLAVTFFALNPLVLIETIVSGHNDVVMMFLVLSSFYLIKQKKLVWGIVFFIASILIKYASLFLLPIFIYFLLKQYTQKIINWEKVFIWSAGLMFTIFLLSQFREEIYPWYATWFLPFIFMLKGKSSLKIVTVSLCFGLLLRDVPYMLLNTYSAPTPLLKILFTISIPAFAAIVLGIKKHV